MAKTVKKQLAKIELLLEKGEFQDALKRLKTLSTHEKLSSDDQFTCLLLESRLRIGLGELEKAHTLTTKLSQIALVQKNPLKITDGLILKAEILWRSDRLDEGLEAVLEAQNLLDGLEPGLTDEINQRKGALLHQGGIIYWFKGELDLALEYHQQSLKIKEELNDKHGTAVSLNNIGLVFWSKGDLNHALEYYQQSLEVSKLLGYQRSTASVLTNLGNTYTKMGDLDKALECQKRSLAIREEMEYNHDIVTTLINLGVVFQLKGDLNQAQNYYQKSFEMADELGLPRDIALAINNLGTVCELKGELGAALDHFQRSYAIYEELGIKEQIGLLLANIGEIYRKKSDYGKAQDYYQRSLTLFQELGNDPMRAVILFELVWVALERQDSALVEQSFQQLQEINARTDYRIIEQRYRVAQALILKASKRARQKLKAAEILEEVVSEEVSDHSLTVTAMIHLCDLLLSELKMTGEDELLGNITTLTNQLLTIAKQQASHSLLAETYLLQSKLALIEMDMGRASKLLTQAQAIAEETGLDKLAHTLADERELLDSQTQKWDLIVKENPTRQEMMTLTKLDDLVGRMIQETVTTLMDEKGITDTKLSAKYMLQYLDLLQDSSKVEKPKFRVGIAQIGLSKTGDILQEFYKEQNPGLFVLKKNKIKAIQSTVRKMIESAGSSGVNILVFPELTIDFNSKQLYQDLLDLAKTHNMYIIPGSYHNLETKQNLSTVISPEGVLWEQEKHIPAIIHFQQQKITEGIKTGTSPNKITIANTEYGRIAIILCRDFLDMDLRVELKNYEPPIDIIINPAFTPVTADFKAAHFDARRSIYAYCFFANVAEFGNSLIYSPEKDREERTVPPKEEGIIFKDIDLFQLRSERKKWAREQQKARPFIQSTR